MQEVNVSLEEMYPLICEQLSCGGQVRFKPKGTSMLPTLRQGIDEVVLTAFKGNLKKYDIAFYRRENGQFVLHRMVKRSSAGGYIMRGDHQFEYEHGITDDNIIGVAAGIYRGGRYIAAGSVPFFLWATLGSLSFRIRFRLNTIVKKFRR